MKPRIWQDGLDILRGGDIVFFAGASFLSHGIQVVTDSPLSHAAMVFPPELLPRSTPLQITESTIMNGKNGPQLNPLQNRLDDPFVWVARLSPRIRQYLEFPAMWKLALQKMGHDRYSVFEIAGYLMRWIPVVNDIQTLYQSRPNEEVCSEYVVQLLAAGGLPGLNGAVMPPQKLAEMKIYSELLQLKGEPTAIPRFNTV